MSRKYTIPFAGTITNANGNVELLAIKPADDKPVRLVGLVVGQTSEVGDSAEEAVEISVLILEATVSDGTGGAASTIQPLDKVDTAAGFTSRGMDTAVTTTSGTTRTHERCPWNLRGSPLERWWADPDTRFVARQGEALCIRWETTVVDDVAVVGTAYVEEI